MSKAHTRAKAYMDHTIWNKDGFVVITGDVGCGKTTLLQKLLGELGDTVLVAKVFQTQLDEVEFLQAVLVEFGFNPFNAKKVELMDMLNSFMIQAYSQFKQLVLIIDDAQNLSKKVLEEIRLLSGLETQKEKILNVILVGQPELNEKLEMPELEQLLQRVRLRFHIGPLSEEETLHYIEHRLQVAGCGRKDVFGPDAVRMVYHYSGGVPRLINTLCDTSMICSFADGSHTVMSEFVQIAVDELQWKPYDQMMASKSESKARAAGSRSVFMEDGSISTLLHDKLDRVNDVVTLLSSLNDKVESMEGQMERIALLLGRYVKHLDKK